MLPLVPIGRISDEAGVVTYRGKGGAHSFAQGSFSHF